MLFAITTLHVTTMRCVSVIGSISVHQEATQTAGEWMVSPQGVCALVVQKFLVCITCSFAVVLVLCSSSHPPPHTHTHVFGFDPWNMPLIYQESRALHCSIMLQI